VLLKSYNDCGLDHLLLLVWVIYTLVWTIYTLVYHFGLAPPSMQRFRSRSDHENVHATNVRLHWKVVWTAVHPAWLATAFHDSGRAGATVCIGV